MPFYEFEKIRPVVHPDAFVHPTAVIIGDVIIEAGCYVGPGAVMRGDLGRLRLGRGANLQDACIVHSFPGHDVLIEDDAHIGHGAVLHGCTVKFNAMVGMNAVIMDGATIGENSFVAALALVKANTDVPDRTLVAGVPARIVRKLRDDEIQWKKKGTRCYQYLARRYLESMREAEPLNEVEPDRPRVPLFDHRARE